MRYFIWNWVGVFGLLVLPLAGCGSTTTEAPGGAGGEGGTAGVGGMAGTGGSGLVPVPPGLWTGSGEEGPDAPFTICFNLNEDGTALVRPLEASTECRLNSIVVDFLGCEGGFSTNEEIPIVDGTFRLLNEQGGMAGFWDISGTLRGNTASGEATVGAVPDGTCSGSWEATPSQ